MELMEVRVCVFVFGGPSKNLCPGAPALLIQAWRRHSPFSLTTGLIYCQSTGYRSVRKLDVPLQLLFNFAFQLAVRAETLHAQSLLRAPPVHILLRKALQEATVVSAAAELPQDITLDCYKL